MFKTTEKAGDVSVEKEINVSWNWEDTLKWVSGAILVIALVFYASYMFGSKEVKYYYVGKMDRSAKTCVYSYRSHGYDDMVYCSGDYTQTIDFTAKANSTLGMHHAH